MNSIQNNTGVFKSLTYVKFTVETKGIIIINEKTGNSQFIKYPQAAIWYFLNRGYSLEKIVHLMSILNSINFQEALKLIQQSLNEWLEAEFITQESEDG